MCEGCEVKIVLDRRLEEDTRLMREEWFDGFWRGAIAAFGLGMIAGAVIVRLTQLYW